MEFDATFLIALISFVVSVFIMNKIFYAPILKIMQDRQNLVEQNYKSAKNTQKEAEKRTEYRDLELEKTRNEARTKISDETKRFKQEYSRQIAEYKEDLSNNILKERETLRNSAIEAKEVLKDNIVDIAKEISQKLLGENIDSVAINKSQIEEEQN